MRLTIKLLIWFIASVLVTVGINGYFTVRGELQRYEEELAEKHVMMGLVLRAAFGEVMDTDGEARAVSMLDYTDRRFRSLDIRWVHLEPDAAPERQPQIAVAELTPSLTADRDVHKKDDGKLRSYIPMHIEGRSLSALEFSETLDGEQAVVRHFIFREVRAVITIVLSVAAAAIVFGVLFVGRPMRRLVEHARRIGRGDLSPMPVITAEGVEEETSVVRRAPRVDEIGELAREMNAMTARLAEAQATNLKALEQLRHAEKLSTVGKLASGLAHELGTPLNVITLRAKAITQGRAVGARAIEAATTIAEQATRMTNLVRQLLDFARRRTTTPQQRDRDRDLGLALVDVEEVLCRTTDLVEAVAAKARVRFDVHMAKTDPVVDDSSGEMVVTTAANTNGNPSPDAIATIAASSSSTSLVSDVAVRADAGQLEQVFTNILMNAIQAMPDGGEVRIATDVVVVTPPADCGGLAGAYVRVVVEDSGIGISQKTLPHIFEPFFTTKGVGEGTGLGLAVCYGIVRDHGGWIDVTSHPGRGARFAVYLPKEVS